MKMMDHHQQLRQDKYYRQIYKCGGKHSIAPITKVLSVISRLKYIDLNALGCKLNLKTCFRVLTDECQQFKHMFFSLKARAWLRWGVNKWRVGGQVRPGCLSGQHNLEFCKCICVLIIIPGIPTPLQKIIDFAMLAAIFLFLSDIILIFCLFNLCLY